MKTATADSIRLRAQVIDDLIAKTDDELAASLSAALHRSPWRAEFEAAAALTRAKFRAACGTRMSIADDELLLAAPSPFPVHEHPGLTGPAAHGLNPGGAA